MSANLRLATLSLPRQAVISDCPIATSYELLSEQLHYCNPIKHEKRLEITNIISKKANSRQTRTQR